jgi:hypothetical protein
MIRKIFIISIFLMIVHIHLVNAQSFRLFAPEVKQEYPSVVYDFLERYLYELDSLQREGIAIHQRIADDKVFFFEGQPNSVNEITADMGFSIKTLEGKSYEVSWTDSAGKIVLGLYFPMQYELILGKPKNIIETELKSEIMKSVNIVKSYDYTDEDFETLANGYYISKYNTHYYLKDLNTATYYIKDAEGVYSPFFNDSEKWYSAANLFQGHIKDIFGYKIFVKQNLYGFKYDCFTIPLEKWLGYCNAMKMTTYFAVEEEREDGIKALFIAQSPDLGFNHVLSLVIPYDFVTNKKCVIKATLNAYIPTQNVAELYKQYVEKPKKKL